MQVDEELVLGWTVVLRRQPARLVEGRPEGGYTDGYELVCCDCGDDPGLDYRDVCPRFQRIRGPYAFPAGIAAYGSTSGSSTGSSRFPRQAGHGDQDRPMARRDRVRAAAAGAAGVAPGAIPYGVGGGTKGDRL